GANGVAHGYKPLIGDFNGDGKDDFGIYDPSGGNWSVFLSTGSGMTSGSIWQYNWGANGVAHGYKPLIGDFNG
ncbi:MAG: hypothetical protein ACPGYP_06420, partial [Solirubrobacterales bacterium]